MNTIYWRMNATQGGANLHPGVNLLPVQFCTRVQIVHMNTALDRYIDRSYEHLVYTFHWQSYTTCNKEKKYGSDFL